MYTLELNLKPYWENNTVSNMEISATIDAIAVNPQGPALDYAAQAFNNICPFPEYDNLSIEDDLGEIPYELKEAPTEYDMADYLGFYFNRSIEGTLKWSYRLFPRILPEGYRSSPYYDFRNEPFGLNGSGMFSFILPKSSESFHVKLHWDLSAMPDNARGIWSYGEGDVEKDLSSFELRFTLFNTGIMNSYEQGEFGVFWFGEPNFEIRPASERLYQVFLYMKDFFHDDDPSFRVFLRRDPFKISGGGSACPRAFISGYSDYGGMNADHWYCVLTHEMTHNWPYMDDRIAGEGTWYTEGATEYYCTMLPYRAGIADSKYTLDRINEKAKERYYDNIYRETSNMDIPKIQWKDRRAQTVPYGRGFIYLGNVDAQLRRLGKGSLDDIAIKYTMCKKNPLPESVWIDFIQKRLGKKGLQDFEDMKAGKLLTPDPDIFGSEFRTIEEEIELDGKMVISYRWELKI